MRTNGSKDASSIIAGRVRRSVRAVLVLVIGVSIPAGAQIIASAPLRNVVYAEIGGAGGLFSLNYERLTDQGVYLRAGYGFWGLTNLDAVREDLKNIVVGATRRFDISDLLKQGDGRIAEAGFAVVAGTYKRTRYEQTEIDGTYASLVPTASLRAEPPAGGFTYRITISPLLPFVNRASAFPLPSAVMWGGISAGYVFR
jgi:hypothetical protein